MEDNLFFLVERVFCWLFLIWGLSLLVQTSLWIRTVRFFYDQSPERLHILSMVLGSLLLPWALAGVLVHNDWFLSLSLVVTLLVWAVLVKSALMILWPQIVMKCRSLYQGKESFLKWYFRGVGIFYLCVSAAIAWGLSEYPVF